MVIALCLKKNSYIYIHLRFGGAPSLDEAFVVFFYNSED